MKFIRKNIKLITIIIVLLIIGSIFLLKKMLVKSAVIADNLVVEENLHQDALEEKEIVEDKVEPIVITEYVDIKGEVNKPGVYIITSNMRIVDAIKEAGGLTENADTSLINLAKKVTDQMVIIIFHKDRIKELESKNNLIEESIVVDPEISIKEEQEITNPPSEEKDSTNNDTTLPLEGTISLNNATKEELMQVPGIGEKKADAIIEYRTETEFTKLEDLLNISGIGEAVYEKIKAYFKL